MQLARFNSQGIYRFQELLEQLRNGRVEKAPLSISEDVLLIEPVRNGKDVDELVFPSRLHMGTYVNSILSPESGDRLMSDVGLWSWLSARFFDSVCPADENGRRNPQSDYRHIPTTDWRNFYRHLIRGPVRILRLFDDDPQRAAIVLCQKPSAPGDIVEQLASRQERITNPAIIEAANRMYFDAAKGRPKRGTAPNWPKAGTLRRYTTLLDQLDLTYDLYSMSVDDILGVLPDEFAPYLK